MIRSGTLRTGIDALDWASHSQALGIGELLLTSWDRDGTGDGYDLDLLQAMSSRVRVPIIASGGAAGADDLFAALSSGADAVLAASIFHDGITTVGDVKASLARRDMEVRL